MSPTDKDAPKSRGIPARQNDAAIKEAFAQQVDGDNHGEFTGIAAKQARENQQRALQIMKSIRAKR